MVAGGDRGPAIAAASVGIVGGGCAGLACAERLLASGFSVNLFDTGKRGAGGLLATRRAVTATGETVAFDTAAQLFSASHPTFRRCCERWECLGWIERWCGRAVRLRSGGELEDCPTTASPVFTAVGGMERLADHLAGELTQRGARVRTQMWASSAERTPDSCWDIKWDLWSMGVVDYLVCAHSGKCAKRLTSAKGLRRCHDVVNRVQLGVIWTLVCVFAEPLDLPFELVLVEGSAKLSMLCNQSAKLGGNESQAQCWVMHSTNSFGWKHKVPQEFVPPETLESVAAELRGAFEDLVKPMRCGRPLPQVVHQHAQLWGAGLPQTVLKNADFVFDPVARAGVCADWCVTPCVEGAFLSGMRLAEAIVAHHARVPGTAGRSFPSDVAEFVRSAPCCDVATFPGWLDAPTQLSEPSPPDEALEEDDGAPGHPAAVDFASCAVADCSSKRPTRWSRPPGPQSGEAAPSGCTTEPGEDRQLPASVPAAAGGPPRGGRWRARLDQPPLVLDSGIAALRPAVSVKAGGAAVELQPGLVWLPAAVDVTTQQCVADTAFRIGGAGSIAAAGSRGRSGGFYRSTRGGGLELNVQQEGRGSFVQLLKDCDPLLEELCLRGFEAAAELSSALPPMDGRTCVFNFYTEDSPGLRWHRDVDETGENLKHGQGRPVVSVSFGDDCDFEYGSAGSGSVPGPSEKVRLRSGDVLVFGGPSRSILHAVTRIYPGTCPRDLRMPAGRLNLTFRHHS